MVWCKLMLHQNYYNLKINGTVQFSAGVTEQWWWRKRLLLQKGKPEVMLSCSFLLLLKNIRFLFLLILSFQLLLVKPFLHARCMLLCWWAAGGNHVLVWICKTVRWKFTLELKHRVRPRTNRSATEDVC